MRDHQRRIVGRDLARDRDTQRLERRGIGEPGLHAPHRLVGPEHQAGSDQQHHGQRHLDDRQRVAGHVAVATGARIASASLQRLVQPDTAPLEHRQRAEHETGGDRNDQREHDRRGVDADQIEARQPRRRKARSGPQGESGQAQPDSAANQAEQETLGQHVARQATAARADGGAHGEFLGTPFGPHEQQVGHVRAGNQQDDADGRRHHPQALAEISDEIIDERADLGREACVFHHPEGHPLGRRELAEGDADHARHVRVDACDVDARAQAADRLVVVARQPDVGPVEAQRQHEIVRGVHEPEALREHADDLATRAVHGDQPADDVRVASELALPVAVAQHDDFRAAVLVVSLREWPADRRLDPEEGQQAVGRDQGIEALGLGKTGDGDGGAVPECDVGQRPRLLAVGDVVGERRVEVADVDAGRCLPEAHQAVGLVERQRLEEDRVDDAEDRDIRADPQRQGQQGGQREHRRADQPAGGVAHVAHQFHHRSVPMDVHLRPRGGHGSGGARHVRSTSAWASRTGTSNPPT